MMTGFFRSLFLTASLLLLFTSQGTAQTPVIFDTDIDSDVDDVEALAMLLALHQRGEIDLLGVIVTSDDPYAPTCVSAINTYFGFPDIPIGFLKEQKKLRNHSRYTRQITEQFPTGLTSHRDAVDGTSLYRRLLAESPDGSVVIVTVGHLSSLQELLQSGRDQYSSLSGQALVNAKVDRWLCMGGKFPEGKEANFYRPDPGSTQYCLEHWTKEVFFCGWEVGNKIITGGKYLERKLPPDSPVYQAYRLYNDFAGRPSWDQAAVLLLLPRSQRYFQLSQPGYCQVAEDGSNEWIPGLHPPFSHRYVTIKDGVAPDKIARYMDRLTIKLHK